MKENSKIIKEISPRLTVLNIPKGKTQFIPSSKIKVNALKVTIHRLNQKGYNFTASERGITGGMNVTNNSINL